LNKKGNLIVEEQELIQIILSKTPIDSPKAEIEGDNEITAGIIF